METIDKNQKGTVIESYNHDPLHRVVLVQLPGDIKNLFFFYIPEHPQVDFGDTLLMNFHDDTYYVFHGNARLKYKISPQPFPGNLLLELISERLNQ